MIFILLEEREGWEEKGEERERERARDLHLLVHSPKHSQDLGLLKLKTRPG